VAVEPDFTAIFLTWNFAIEFDLGDESVEKVSHEIEVGFVDEFFKSIDIISY
jgi:hypothetical protein